jgi:hypothetical protein
MQFSKGVHHLLKNTHEDLEDAVNAHRKYVEVLRAGGFVCFLPNVIDPTWREPAPRLAGFPTSICFTGLPPDLGRQPVAAALTSCYWFDPLTYQEDEQIRAMTYYTEPRNEYRVELLHHKRESQWEGRKCRGGEVLRTADGPELRQFIIQLSLLGIERDELVQPLLTCKDTASASIYVFTPTQHSSEGGRGSCLRPSQIQPDSINRARERIIASATSHSPAVTQGCDLM